MADYQAGLKISLDDQLSSGAQAAEDRLNKLADAADKAGKSTDDLQKTTERVGPSFDVVNRKIDENAKLTQQLDTINRRYEQGLAALRAEFAASGGSADDLAEKERRLGVIRDNQVASAQKQAAALKQMFSGAKNSQDNLTDSTDKSSRAFRQLEVQTSQAIAQLSSGGGVIQTFIAQFHGLFDSMQASGTKWSELGSAVGNFVSKIGGVPTLVGVTVVAAFTSMGVAAERHQEKLHALQNTLELTRNDYANIAVQIDQTAASFAKLNDISKSDARSGLGALAAGNNLDINQLSDYLKIVNDMATVMGTKVPEEAAKFSKALRDPAAAAKEAADGGIRGFTQALADQIDMLEKSGHSLEAQALYAKTMGDAVKGAAQNVSPLQQAIRDLGVTFSTLTSPIGNFFGSIGDFLVNMAALAIKKIDDVMKFAIKAYHLIPGTGPVESATPPPVGPNAEGAAAHGLPSSYTPNASITLNPNTDPAARSAPFTPSSAASAVGSPYYGTAPATTGRVTFVIPNTQLSKAVYDELYTIARQKNFGGTLQRSLAEADLATNITMVESGGYQMDPRDPTKVYTSSAGALGRFQLMPATAKSLGVDPTTSAGNDEGGLKYIAQLFDKYHGDPVLVTIAYHWGPGNLDKFMSGDLSTFGKGNGQDNLDYVLHVLGATKAQVETAVGRSIPTNTLSAQDTNAATNLTHDTLSFQIRDNQAQQSLLTSAIADSKLRLTNDQETGDTAAYQAENAQLAELEERLRKAQAAATGLITEQQKSAQAAELETRNVGELNPVKKALNDIETKYAEIQRTKGELPDKNAMLKEESAYMSKLTADFYGNVDAINRSADAQDKLNPLLEEGGRQALYHANQTKAEADAYSKAIPNSEDYRQKVKDETDALNHDTNALIDRQAAIDISKDKVQNETLQEQIDLLGQSADVRNREMAGLQRRHELGLTLNDDLTAEQQRSVDSAKATADLASSYELARDSLANFGNLISSSFTNIFQALTNAFVSGQQKAIDWGNIMRGVAAQVLNAFLQLAVLNPILNSLGTSDKTLPTLFSTINALTGNVGGASSSGGGLLGTASNALSLGNGAASIAGFDIGEELGLTGPNGLLTGIGNSLGLTGSGSLLGGIGSALSAPAVGGVPITVATSDLGGILGGTTGAAEGAAATGASGAASIGTVGAASFGNVLGGVGLGFTAGSLTGGAIQGAMDKTGPAPMIGAGVGALGGAVLGGMFFGPIGALIGGLLGGTAGGSLGGLIGPHPATPFATQQIDVTPDGLLKLGTLTSQKEDTTSLTQDTARQIADLNNILVNNGIKIANPYTTSTNRFDDNGMLFRVGNDAAKYGVSTLGNSSAYFGPEEFSLLRFDLSQSKHPELQPVMNDRGYINAPFSGFSDSAQLGAALSAMAQMSDTVKNVGKAANDGTPLLQHFIDMLTNTATDQLASLSQEITQFVGTTVPALEKFGKANGSLNDSFDQINAAFLPAIDESRKLGYATNELTDLYHQALQKTVDEVNYQYDQLDRGFQSRVNTANDNAPGVSMYQKEQDALYAFETQATQQRHDLDAQIVATFGDAVRGTANYNAQILQLENALGAERLQLVQSWEQQIADAMKQLTANDNALTGRYLTATAATPYDQENVALFNFDQQAQTQREQMDAALVAIWGDAVRTTAGYNDQMSLLEKTLGAERLAIVKQYSAQIVAAQKQIAIGDQNELARYYTAQGTLSGDLGQQKNAALQVFDLQAQQQRDALKDQLVALYGDAITTTAGYAAEMSLLEQTLGAERLVVAKQYDDQIVAQQKAAADQQQQQWQSAQQAAASAIGNITQYVMSLETGSMSPLSGNDQYGLALKEFNAVAGSAQAGDANSLQQITSYANAFLNASRTVNGSGLQYVADFNKVVDVLSTISQIQPDSLTNSFLQQTVQTQTVTLVAAINDLKREVTNVKLQLQQNQAAPARVAA